MWLLMVKNGAGLIEILRSFDKLRTGFARDAEREDTGKKGRIRSLRGNDNQ